MLPFSQRFGFVPVRQSLQIDSMDQYLRNGLWNVYSSRFINAIEKIYTIAKVEQHIWREFIKASNTTYDEYNFQGIIANWFLSTWPWFKVYDFIEFCYDVLNTLTMFRPLIEPFVEECNRVLERDISAYRLVNGSIARFTSEEEIAAIEQATQESTNRWQPVTEHLRTALGMLSNRQNPDYRNSVKESISAIESACKVITGDDKTTLGQALKTMEAKGSIHPSLKAGFDKLYGYTSDHGGIRHAMLEGSNPVTFDEAKFMLVACSAFSNYLQPNLQA